MEYLILGLGWLFFYVSHTFLASLNIKRKIKAWMGNGYKWYRLCYSLFATLTFFALLLFAGSIDPLWLFVSTNWTTYLGFMLATFGTIIAMKSMKGVSTGKFIGLKPHDDLKEKQPLITGGWYQYMRHPLYAGLILIFLGYLFYLPNLASLIHLLALLFYLPFGIYHEERKLLEQYGESYANYQNKVPPLLPRFKI
ncbi:MAG: isoprenylcysteine carboxylmethyltransferase family protein [Cyclobacterium sp.]|uniref:methyltransferase family protein n=1 Tax=unclassified Cyclobacterium TaxID=2615055 RepID=UPI0013D369E0|nr:isoprenylcysteine carboxylmethyltransferase family protein [Cyclobacterium sp. SYSU L10401]